MSDSDYEFSDYSDQDEDYYSEPQTLDQANDFEYFQFDCLSIKEVENLLDEKIEILTVGFNIPQYSAKILLNTNQWALPNIVENLLDKGTDQILIDLNIKPSKPSELIMQMQTSTSECPVCIDEFDDTEFRYLACGHSFCISCWTSHFDAQINRGISTAIECMENECKIIVPEDFASNILTGSNLSSRYQRFAINDYVSSNPNLVFCPGTDCNTIIHALEVKSRRVTCSRCRTSFCFKCATDYHAPCDCATIKKWLAKCTEDSETAKYLRNNTKDCPRCLNTIEKNGGCNAMICSKCNLSFCWFCLVSLKGHRTCNRFVGDKNVTKENEGREIFRKYLFYFDRWAIHAKSLRLEEKTLQTIGKRIDEKVMKREGTWIDWEYLVNAAGVLAKCRYTLQYTYAYAFYLEAGDRKELFERLQAGLEEAIEKLSELIEKAETSSRGEIEQQMSNCDKQRVLLLHDFNDE